jgi:hypothetical protein
MVKFLLSQQPIVINPKDKAKYCSTCGNLATQNVCFDVGEGVTVIEKYCYQCAQKVMR